MRGLTLLIATILTFGYGFAAQAAINADIRRVAGVIAPAAPTEDATRVWYGGMLAPVTVEVSADPKCQLT